MNAEPPSDQKSERRQYVCDADEYDRLTAEVADLQQFKEWAEPQCEDHVKQKQEIERLRAGIESIKRRELERTEWLSGEIERLRGALDTISRDGFTDSYHDDSYEDCYWRVVNIARRALALKS